MSSAKREVARIGTRIKKLLNLMLDDKIAVDEGKARIYRTRVTELAEALQQPESRLEATEGPCAVSWTLSC